MRNFKIVIFLGVDGSGKSTLINSILKKDRKKFNKIHFVPDYFRKNNKQNINPHKQIKRGKIFSLLKILYWLVNYQIFKILNYNSKKIYIFDRYIYDVLIDPLRYRFSLSKIIITKIVKFAIKPDLIVLLTGDPKKIYFRKKEIKLNDTIKLNDRYIKFVQKFDVKIILNCLNKIDSNRDKILNHIKKLSL
jgi:thymidylate kinase